MLELVSSSGKKKTIMVALQAEGVRTRLSDQGKQKLPSQAGLLLHWQHNTILTCYACISVLIFFAHCILFEKQTTANPNYCCVIVWAKACFAAECVGWCTSCCAVQAFLIVLISLAAKCAVGNIAHWRVLQIVDAVSWMFILIWGAKMAGRVLWCSQAAYTAVRLLVAVVVHEESVMRCQRTDVQCVETTCWWPERKLAQPTWISYKEHLNADLHVRS